MDKNDGAASLVRSDALLAIEDVLDEMSRIIKEHPAAMEYETDARYTWPTRWGALLKYLKAKRDISNNAVSCGVSPSTARAGSALNGGKDNG